MRYHSMISMNIINNTFCLAAVFSAIVILSLAALAAADTVPRVAVFSQEGFPFYGPPSQTSPAAIADDLNRAGLRTDLLDAAALADPARFNAQTYDALVMPYGNIYPWAAFANLVKFHEAGGCFVLSGVPFTHAAMELLPGKWQDMGHDSAPALYGPKGIGVGGFRTTMANDIQIAPGDPLNLAALKLDWKQGETGQTLDIATLPPSDRVVPILTAVGEPAAALVIHSQNSYSGAVDVWIIANVGGNEAVQAYGAQQIMARGMLAALAQKGRLTDVQKRHGFQVLDRLPRPQIYADVKLPLPPRPYPTLQPKMPMPARHLYVADVRPLDRDTRLLLFSLQGLVNRTQPRIYLISDNSDSFWLDTMQKQGHTDAPIPVADPLSLLQMFHSAYQGAVVPDPNIYVCPDVAVCVAGADDLLLATPELAARLNLPIKTDLRGKFLDDAAAMRYVRTELLPRLNPYLGAILSPRVLGSQLDDIIAAKGVCFWVTGPKEAGQSGANMTAETEELEALLTQMPLGAVIRGYPWAGDGSGMGERPGVALFSRFGKMLTASDYVSNYSVMSGIPLPRLAQKPQPPAPTLDRAKVYLALTLSDGDNLSIWRGAARPLFEDPLLGTFPVAFGMGPTLIDVAPPQLEWYYAHMTGNNEFVCDVSGAGYVYPSAWGKALHDQPGVRRRFYHDWTQDYMARTGMKGLRVMEASQSDLAWVGAETPNVAFQMPDYGYLGEDYAHMTYALPGDQPVFRAGSFGPEARDLADQVRAHAGTVRPAFVNVFVSFWGANLSKLKETLTLLGPEYVAVTPSQLNTLYREAHPR